MTAAEVARQVLPTLNACLNGLSAVLVLAAWVAIRRGARATHWKLMTGALGSSTLFLASYLTRVALVGSHPFAGTGASRIVYLVILFSHMVLAAAVVPMVLVTLVRALRSRFPAHRAVARWTLPVWLYVSVTGVVVYLMLYHWPQPPVASRPDAAPGAHLAQARPVPALVDSPQPSD